MTDRRKREARARAAKMGESYTRALRQVSQPPAPPVSPAS
jgi:hypothetical protein